MEITCGGSASKGQGGCGAEECPMFDDYGPGDFAGNWLNPLDAEGWGVTCIPAGYDDSPANGCLDSCDADDCNNNGVDDWVDIAQGTSADCNNDCRPDDCQLEGQDCDGNGVIDYCEIAAGSAADCNANATPDACDIDPADPDGDGQVSDDCDLDTVPDECQRAYFDCNGNAQDDYCDILFGVANDNIGSNGNPNGIPDACDWYGKTVILDFEDKTPADADYDYIIDQVSDQPIEAAGPLFRYEWATWDQTGDGLVDLPDDGYADVVSGSLTTPSDECPVNTKYLLLTEAPTTPVTDWGSMSPHIHFSDPATGTVTNWAPRYQEISMDVEFTGGASTLDWDFWFGSIFDSVPGSANTYYVDEGRVLVSFDTANDDTTHIYVSGQESQDTEVDWTEPALNTTHHLRVVIDYGSQIDLDFLGDAGKVYWDGAMIATFTPSPSESGQLIMDKVFFSQYRNDYGTYHGESVKVDCIKLIRSDGQDEFTDCNENGIRDDIDLSGGASNDCNNNFIPDECDADACHDCNHNFIPDECEIEAGSAADANENDVIDVCEKDGDAEFTINFNSGWSLGVDVKGQFGWFHLDNANEPPTVGGEPVNPFGTTTVKVGYPGPSVFGLEVAPAPEQDYPHDMTFSLQSVGTPRYTLDEYDVEEWSVKMYLQDTPNASTEPEGRALFWQASFEIADLCDDDVDLARLVYSDQQLNAGIVASSRESGPGVNSWYWYAYRNEAGEPALKQLNGSPTYSADQQYQVTLRIWNKLLGGNAAGLIDVEIDGTPYDGDVITEVGGYDADAGRSFGGDRQVVLRSHQVGTTAWFEDIKYEHFNDCDNDGEVDSVYIARMEGYVPPGVPDLNDNDIPDRCEDCDADCFTQSYPYGTGQATSVDCLDPEEADGNDCNGNGIPDECDIDPTLPALGSVNGLGPPADPDQVVWRTRYGGGSSDCNTNGIPDDCEFPDEDCNKNGALDECDLIVGTSTDLGGLYPGNCGGTDGPNGVPDDCDPDCNNNNQPDWLDLTAGVGDSVDIFNNATGAFGCDMIPDECCGNNYGADFNNSGKVDLYDYQFMQKCVGQVARNTSTYPNRRYCGCADLNNDGWVDEYDEKLFHIVVEGP
jgi:hypothetical protein